MAGAPDMVTSQSRSEMVGNHRHAERWGASTATVRNDRDDSLIHEEVKSLGHYGVRLAPLRRGRSGVRREA